MALEIKHFARNNQSGFTLMELMIVIGIIGILSAIVLPEVFNPKHRVKKVARELMGDMQSIKMAAVKNNESWRIIFGGGGYTIQDGNGNTKKTITFSNFAEGVAYGHGAATTNATSGGGTFPVGDISYGGNTLTFNPRGTCSSGYVYLAFKDNVYSIGTLSTGAVKLRRWSAGEWR